MIKKAAGAFIFCFCILLSLSAPGNADERILSFDSFIRVNPDGSQQVTETIRVRAEGKEIKRGIFRDFPTRYRDRYGNNYVVGFEVIKVLRDGRPEPYHSQPLSNGARVYIGEESVYLPSGSYTYTIEYATDRQLGFFKDFDELYWNVSGNGWVFPIDTVSCTIALPGSAGKQIMQTDAYTGPSGAQGKDFTVGTDASGRTRFATTKALAPYEGLTVAVRWPKGFVTEPALEQKIGYLVKDNAGMLAAVIGLLAVLGYYLFVWNAVGRDPEKGVIIPLYEPDKNLSPAAMRYLTRMGYDGKVFTAAIISMAVKGFLTIREEGGEYTLEKTGQPDSVLSPEESAAAKALFDRDGTRIVMKNRNHLVIGDAMRKLQKKLKNVYETSYFLTNRKYFVPGLVLSFFTVAGAGILQAGIKFPVVLFMSVWLSGWTIGVLALGMSVFKSWKPGGNKALAAGSTLFLLPFLAGELFGMGMLVWATSALFLVFFFLIIFINALFYHLLKAPTALGRRVMDRIEGFKMYLSVAEGDILKTMKLSDPTPELYERYLPYALALEVEQPWSERFSGILNRQTGEGHPYRPGWYSSSRMADFSAAGFSSSLAGSFANAVSSSGTAPGSSSGGGGGGSSGGGGGGGGGGGW